MTEQLPPTPRQIAQQLNRMRSGQAAKKPAQSAPQPAAAKKSARVSKDWGSIDAPRAYNNGQPLALPALNVSKGDVARFIFLPQIGNSLKSVGFSLAVIMQTFAVLLIAARLLPVDHPARTLEGAKRYHLLNLLGEARRNLKYTRAALPQWAIFGSICGFIISFASVLMLMLAKFGFGVAMAMAAGGDPAGSTGGLKNGAVLTGSMLTGSGDIAGNMLDVIFNLNNISNTTPAINTMLQMYSYTMLVFAGIILLWIIVSTIADTARTGVPFGKHFNPVWAPIRLVVAIGMLVPLGAGLNSGQYVVLSLAKWGSSQATQIWSTFAAKVDTGQGALTSAGGLSQSNENARVMQELMSQVACELYRREAIATVDPSLLCYNEIQADKNTVSTADGSGAAPTTIYGDVSKFLSTPTPNGIAAGGGFTYTTTPHLADQLLADKNNPPTKITADPASKNIAEPLLSEHYNTSQTLAKMVTATGLVKQIADIVSPLQEDGITPNSNHSNGTVTPNTTFISVMRTTQDNFFAARRQQTDSSLAAYNASEAKNVADQLNKSGWIAAPIWINTIAQGNSTFITAKNAVPIYTPPATDVEGLDDQLQDAAILIGYKDPESMRQLLMSGGGSQNDFENLKGLFLLDGKPIENPIAHLTTLGRQATALAIRLNSSSADAFMKLPANDISVAGVARFYKNYNTALTTKNTAVSKLALPDSIISKERYDASVSSLDGPLKGMRSAGMPLAIFGFLLGYMLPLMPFFRFILGVLGWLLLVFEALLAIPLFALAHLKTDGDGFMSQMAQSGYIMILGLIIRPILMVIGLVVGLICFNGIAQLTNALFMYAITNVTIDGAQKTTDLDPVSLAINMMLYATFMITLANSAFKAIDLIPNHVMGWLGSRMDSRVDDAAMVQQNVMGGVMAGAGSASFAMGQAMGMPGMQMGQSGNTGLSNNGGPSTPSSNKNG